MAKLREKIGYGMSAMTYEIEVGIVMTYMLLFCTDVLLLDAALVGTLLLVPKVLDAITDIVITNIADKTKTRFGKYRPWMLSGIGLAVLFVCFFWNPAFLQSTSAKIFWVCAIYVLMVPLFETAYMCPMIVMGTIMSPDNNDRLDFAVGRSIGENVADFITNGLCMTIVLAFGSYRDVRGWRVMAVIFAVVMIICTLVGFFSTKERVQVSNKDVDGSDLKWTRKLSIVMKDGQYLKLLGIQFGFLVPWTANMCLFPYFCINVLGHEEWVAILSTIGVVAQLCGTISVTFFGRKTELRNLIGIGSVLMLTGGILMFFANSFVTALAFQIVKGYGVGLVYVCTWSSFPMMTDYIEWKTGIAIPGMVLAVVSFATKLFSAVGTYFSTWVLTLGGYNATLVEQSDSTIWWIRASAAGVLIFGAIIVFVLNYLLKALLKEKVEHYKTEIRNRVSQSIMTVIDEKT